MKENNRGYVVLISLIVALGGFLMGFDASVISGVVKFIEPEFDLTKIELGWAVSSLTLTATLAMMIAGPLSDKFGRKRLLSFAAVLYAISAIASALAPTFIFLVIARMIGGFGVGASLIIAPMYIAEIAPPKIRGTMVSFNQLNIVIGISAAFFTNYLILKLGQSEAEWAQAFKFDHYNWRWMLGLEMFPALIYFFSLVIVPRSPRWLVMKGYYEEALKTMQKASGETAALNDIKAIKESIQEDSNKKKSSLKDIFNPALRTVLIIGLVLAVLQQITGINSVFFYAPMIFEQSGIGTNAAFSQAIYVGLANLVFTILAMFLIDKVGRKLLLIVGMFGIAISMFLLSYGFGSATYTLTEKSISELPAAVDKQKLESLQNATFTYVSGFKSAVADALGEDDFMAHEVEILKSATALNANLILLGILAFVASFAVSIGPVMWVLFSELFPNTIRAVAISFVGFVNSVVSFLVQLVFPWELETIGNSMTFLIYGLFAAAGLLFVLTKVPETKGKSLEELEKILVK
ncbi:MAG: MFS transporter [Marinilabiliales bacterium]|nr:MAG: MFS transporter [Marinilabiliales bacterium]